MDQYGRMVANVSVYGDLKGALNRSGLASRFANAGDKVTIDTMLRKLGAKKQSSENRVAEGRMLYNKYGDRTRLETLNAIVDNRMPHDQLADEWNDYHYVREYAKGADGKSHVVGIRPTTPDERENVIKNIIQDYRDVAKQVLYLEFPWIRAELTKPQALEPFSHPVINRLEEERQRAAPPQNQNAFPGSSLMMPR